MSDSQEKGFLSEKFENWSSEPIPNGWSNIEAVLEKDRKKKPPIVFWLIPFAIFISAFFGYFGYKTGHNQESMVSEGASSIKEMLALEKNEIPNASTMERVESDFEKKNENSALVENTDSEKNTNFKKTSKDRLSSKNSDGQAIVSYSKTLKSGLMPNVSLKSILALDAKSYPGNKNKTENREKSGAVINKSGFMALVNPSNQKSGLRPEGRQSEIYSQSPDDQEFRQPDDSKGSDVFIGKSELKEIDGLLALQYKIAAIPLMELIPGEPRYVVFPPLSRRKKKSPVRLFIGSSIGFAGRTFQLDQREAVNQLKIQNVGSTTHAVFGQLEGNANFTLFPWLKLISGIQLGVFNQTIELKNTSKVPASYVVKKLDSLRFSMNPQNPVWNETRSQNLVFGNFEFGLKPVLFQEAQSGPFASVLVWTALSQNSHSTLSGGARFLSPVSRVSIGYKFGYQHLLFEKWNLQVFTTELPARLLAQSEGISVAPRFFGFGVQYLLR